MKFYKLSSSMIVNGVVRLAGTKLSESDFKGMGEDRFARLLADEHLVELDESTAIDGTPSSQVPQLLPQKNTRKQPPTANE